MIYASLGYHGVSAYPHCLLLVNADSLISYFECYVATDMANIRVCRDQNITLFDIQSQIRLYSSPKMPPWMHEIAA